MSSEIKIDESKHVTLPTTFQKLKNSVISIIMGIVFVQVLLIAFTYFSFFPISVVVFIDHPLFIIYLFICAILGWFAGESFIDMLKNKGKEWNLWIYR